MNELWVFLPGIIGLGLVTSYEDIKENKIRNKWVVGGLLYAVLGLFALVVVNRGVNWGYLAEWGTNLLFATTVGFGLWYAKVWTAGDGKLFIAFAALVPFVSYSNGYVAYIPSITLLINIFLIGALYLVLSFLLKPGSIKKIVKNLLPYIPKRFGFSLVYVLGIMWGIRELLKMLSLPTNFILILILSISVFMIIKNKKIILIISLSLIFARSVLGKIDLNPETAFSIIAIIFVFSVLTSLLENKALFSSLFFSKKIRTSALRPGMVLSAKEKGQDEPEGVTKKEIISLKKQKKWVRVSSTIPFAPIISSAILISILVNGNLLISLQLLQNLWG